MFSQHDREHMTRIERLAGIAFVARWHFHQMNLTALKATGQIAAGVVDQLDIDIGMAL